MKKALKVIGVILLAIAILGFVVTIWFLDHNLFDNGLEVLIYMIGYGESHINPIVRLALALIGILLVGAFSSLITVLLIEQKSKLKIENKIHFSFTNNPSANFYIKTKRWDLYEIEIKLLFPFNGTIYRSHTYDDFAFLPSNHKQNIRIHIQRGTPIFWYLQSLIDGEKVDELIVKIDFINGKNNQSYSAIQKFYIDKNVLVNGITRAPNKLELESVCGTHFNLHELILVNSTCINFDQVNSPLPFNTEFKNGICAHFNFTNANNSDFGMLFFKKPFNGLWDYFQNEDYCLTFQYYLTTNVRLKLEIKSNQGLFFNYDLDKTDELVKVKIPLQNFEIEDIGNIKELCFVVFSSDNTAKCGDFYIFDCHMEKYEESNK